jgi:hypothetical protein
VGIYQAIGFVPRLEGIPECSDVVVNIKLNISRQYIPTIENVSSKEPNSV